jgi:hypothetical protein
VHIVTALRMSVGTFQGMMLGTRFLSIIPACTCVDAYSSGLNVQLSYAYGGMDFFFHHNALHQGLENIFIKLEWKEARMQTSDRVWPNKNVTFGDK